VLDTIEIRLDSDPAPRTRDPEPKSEMLEQISICLTALYLRGLPRPINPLRRRWVRVVSCLRTADCDFADFDKVLEAAGFREESILLGDRNLVDDAHYHRSKVVTALDDGYPKLWLERLREGAPPVLWKIGSMPQSPYIAVVGSRHIDASTRAFAEEIGHEAVRLGYAVVSGGAIGSDLAAAKGALLEGGEVLEVLPHGIDHFIDTGKCGLAVCAPHEEFSTASAMERNTLIYAAADNAVVIQARFKEGGTWIGAFEATRKKLCPLIVRSNDSQASRALIGLGATPLDSPAQLGSAIDQPPGQRGLFGIG